MSPDLDKLLRRLRGYLKQDAFAGLRLERAEVGLLGEAFGGKLPSDLARHRAGGLLMRAEIAKVIVAIDGEEPLAALAQLGDAVPNREPEGGGSIRG